MIHIDFVCTGNICRSPMAEVIIRQKLIDASLDPHVHLTSSGIGGWHVGNPADSRALAELATAGYDGSTHRAAQFDGSRMNADLIVALDTRHVSELVARDVPEEKIRLLRSFDPDAPSGAGVEDPYYGGPEGFTVTRQQIEAAADGILDWVRERVE